MSNLMIQINYTQAIAQADELLQVANNIKNLSEEDLAKIMADIRNCWEGKNADNYLAKAEVLRSNLAKTAALIRKTADAIRVMATNIYEAEMEAESIAEIRTYGN